MNSLYTKISRIPNYVRRFGALSGLRLLLQVERKVANRSAAVRQYRLPAYPAPIALRECVGDHAVFWQCLVLDQYDFRIFPQSRRLVSEYNRAVAEGRRLLIIDCGANIGLASVWMAKQFPEAVIYGIEPDKQNLEVARGNTECFGERVKLLHGGVWATGGHLNIVNREAGPTAFRVAPAANSGTGLRAYTIGEICALAGVEAPWIVKVDIEGAQKNLFEENTEWVETTSLIMLELDDWLLPWQGTSRSFFSCVSRYPCDYLLAGETIFCFRDFAVNGSAD